MKRVLLAVEGQTEERFVKDILAPHLRAFGVQPTASLLRTKVVKEGGYFKGGLSKFVQIEERVRKLLMDSDAALVTTMFDYYGRWREDFLKNYRGGKEPSGRSATERVTECENEMKAHFDHQRFRPFLALHEFEALLFAAPVEIASVTNQPGAEKELIQIRHAFPTPEDIDDDPQNVPSRRILRLVPGYQKPAHGAIIAERIGLAAMREECPHFGEWLTELEAVGLA